MAERLRMQNIYTKSLEALTRGMMAKVTEHLPKDKGKALLGQVEMISRCTLIEIRQ
jgi:hypothetical protein